VKTKSRTIRSNWTEFFSVLTPSRPAAGCLAGLILVLPHPAAVQYSCRSEESFTSIFRVSKIDLEGPLVKCSLSLIRRFLLILSLPFFFSLLHHVWTGEDGYFYGISLCSWRHLCSYCHILLWYDFYFVIVSLSRTAVVFPSCIDS